MKLSLTRSVSAAFVMECVLVLGIFILINHTAPIPLPKPQPVMMVTMNAVLPAPPTPAPPKPVVKTPPKPKLDPHAIKKEVVKKVDPKPTKSEEVTKPTPTTSEAKSITQPSKPVAAAQGKPDINGVFKEKVRSAVQDAVIYPAAAKIAHLVGQVQVWFMYRDGRVSSPRILTSSGSAMLDRAALAAVSSASYPMPTKELADRDLPFEIWVKFTQAAD